MRRDGCLSTAVPPTVRDTLCCVVHTARPVAAAARRSFPSKGMTIAVDRNKETDTATVALSNVIGPQLTFGSDTEGAGTVPCDMEKAAAG